MLTFLIKVYNVYDRPYIKGLPGELAFFFMWSIAPFILVISRLSSIFNLSVEWVMELVEKYTLPEFADLIKPFLNSKTPMDKGTFFFIVFAIYLSSKGFYSLIRASNIMYGLDDHPTYIKSKIKSFLMTFIIAFLLIFMLLLPVLGGFIMRIIYRVFEISTLSQMLFDLVRWLITLFFIYMSVQYLYFVAPDEKVSARDTRWGSLFTTTGWIVSSALFSYYLANFANYDEIYGNLSNIIILMFWFFILANILVIGMAINVALREK